MVDYTKDYIIDKIDDTSMLDEVVLEKLKKKTDLLSALTSEPVIEELDETIEEIMTKRPEREKISGFPLDHKIYCKQCAYEGKVGFRQRFCPKCGVSLIDPRNATDPEGYYEKRVRKTNQ